MSTSNALNLLNVGIGTTAPDSKLEIAGGGYNSSLKIKGAASNTGIQFEDSDGNTDGYVYADSESIGFLDAGAHWMIQCKNDDFINFQTNNHTEHMRITSAGNVGIGASAPDSHLHISSSVASATASLYIEGSGSSVVAVDGTNGRLFSVTDEMSGSIFSANTIAGMPVIDARSDYSTHFGGDVIPSVTATHDLGSDSKRWDTVYTSDLSLKNELGDWTLVEGEDDIYLHNNKNGKKFKFMLQEVDNAPPKRSE